MKSTFFGFYSIDEETLKNIWQAESTLFVFDTNCLLNLYRCEDHTREDILGVMDEISSRTWIPFQVGLEYQRNRRTVIEDSVNSLRKIQNELESIYQQNFLSSCNIKKHLYNSLHDEISELQNKIKKPIDDYINEKIAPRIASKSKISELDSIRIKIDSIIEDKVGLPPTQKEINEINEEGETRYANKQAPGYSDGKKKDISFFHKIEMQNKFGDLYLWKEIIKKASCEKIKNVIFICDDNKEDWWFKLSGQTYGAWESLKTEIIKESNIENFKLINQLTFLHEAKSHLENITIRDSSLKEVEELSHVFQDENYSHDNIARNDDFIEKTSNVDFYRTVEHYKHNNFYHHVKKHNLENSKLLLEAKLNAASAATLLSKTRRAIRKAFTFQSELIEAMGESQYNAIMHGLNDRSKVIRTIVDEIDFLLSHVELISNDSMSNLLIINKNLEALIQETEDRLGIIESFLADLL